MIKRTLILVAGISLVLSLISCGSDQAAKVGADNTGTLSGEQDKTREEQRKALERLETLINGSYGQTDIPNSSYANEYNAETAKLKEARARLESEVQNSGSTTDFSKLYEELKPMLDAYERLLAIRSQMGLIKDWKLTGDARYKNGEELAKEAESLYFDKQDYAGSFSKSKDAEEIFMPIILGD